MTKPMFLGGAPLVLIAGAMLFFAAPAMADSNPSPRLLTVSGTGEVRAAPDEAKLSAGVVTQARTAQAALADNSRAMNGVFDALKRLGIPEKSIQTSEISISAQYATDAHGNNTQKIAGYQATNTVMVIVDDLDKLGGAIDALVSSGANSLGDVDFTIRDPKPLLDEARAAAVKDAMARAQIYAKAAGVELGPIDAINESGFEGPRPMTKAMAPMGMAMATPIAAGEASVTAGVSITYEIR